MVDRIQDQPLYTRPELGRLLGLQSRTIGRWFEGYTAHRPTGKTSYKPWLATTGQDQLYSFTDLMELWFVKRFQAFGATLPHIQDTYQKESQRLGTPHPFLKKNDWRVVAGRIITDFKSGNSRDAASDQYYLDEIVRQVGDGIDFDADDFARFWYPLGKDKPLVVDPAVSCGFPTVKGRRLRSEAIYDLWKAEGEDVEVVMDAFFVGREEVEAALDWERWIHQN